MRTSKGKGWRAYQETVPAFFRSLGLEATTNFTINGVRTTHAIDVYVKSFHVGFDVVWIVECKQWTKKVTKLHVLALREIVTDVGADRGILLSEKGFQSGALEAATLTDVRVMSLAQLRGAAGADIMAMRRLIAWSRAGKGIGTRPNRLGAQARSRSRRIFRRPSDQFR